MNEPVKGTGSPEPPREYAAPGIVVTWDAVRCQHAAECVRGLPQVFNSQARPWIDPSAAGKDEIVVVVDRCPSYALGYRTNDGHTRQPPINDVE